MRLLFFIGITGDYDVVVTGRPKKYQGGLPPRQKKDPPLGSPRRARCAHALVRAAYMRTRLAGIPVVTEIQMETVVAWKHR
jgi:hypothetical protein